MSAETIKVNCSSCGSSIRVPTSAVGRRAKCPKCAQTFLITDPDVEAPEESGADDLLSGVGGEAPAPQAPRVELMPCPHCGKPNAASAGICAHCRKSLIGATPGGAGIGGAAAAAVGALGGVAKLGGGLTLGIVGSAIGAAIGAAIWTAVAYFANYELGWIAWGLGGLAGIGMHLGARDTNSYYGVIAAVIAILGIVLAKFALVVIVLNAAFVVEGVDEPRERLIELYAGREIPELDVPENATDEQVEAEYEKHMVVERPKAKQRVDAMSDDEVRRELEQIDAEVAETLSTVRTSLFMHQFTLFDLIFAFFAIGTAYRVGAYGFGAA